MTRSLSLSPALVAVKRLLGARGWMVIGGVAIIARGVPRTTRDIDVTVTGAALDLEALVERARAGGLVPRLDDPVAFARRTQVLLLVHEETGVPVDVTLAWLEFEAEAISRAEVLRLGRVRVPVARADDLVLYKLVGWRPVDRQDLGSLIERHRDAMDVPRLRAWGRVLSEAVDAPERAEALETLLDGRR